ncbi:co-chaperone YbbN [Paraphotobacterium marinum]|uniref:Co-chaperone YbbN n=1 Tax=Paraphotobacterium marinum TaxID=1755811 RepID=A0A220VCR3_9GAMM|nr:tetratricopeptide repeat protein [Paraphotobacterium marinum]ASK77763.1 co-chaperone YbbN [Paraphotobacterium marinum]
MINQDNTISTEINQENFQEIIESSQKKPLLIIFWAPSIPESIENKNLIENIAINYQESLTIADINCESQQIIASQFGIRSIPTIALFKNGQPVEGLEGLQTKESLIQLFDNHLPSQDDILFEQIKNEINNSKYSEALRNIKKMSENFSQKGALKLLEAECQIELNNYEQAEQLLEQVPLQDQTSKYNELSSKIELHNNASETPEIKTLEEKLKLNNSDYKVMYQLSIAYNEVHKFEKSLSLMFEVLSHDINYLEGGAKKSFLNILSSLGQDNDIAKEYRKKYIH